MNPIALLNHKAQRSLLLIFFSFLANHALAQAEKSVVSVEFSIKELGFDLGERKIHPVWKFYKLDTLEGSPYEHVLKYGKKNDEECYDKYSKKSNKTFEIDEKDQLSKFNSDYPGFGLKMECFTSGRKGSTCTFNPKEKDNDRGFGFTYIQLDKTVPGEWSETQTIWDKSNRFSCTYMVRYSFSRISNDLTDFTGTIFPCNKEFVLKLPFLYDDSFMALNNWDYSFGDDNWTDLKFGKKSGRNGIRFNPLNDLFGGKLEGPKSVFFRLRAYNGRNASSVQMTEISKPLEIKFAPPPPVVNGTKTPLPSCAGASNGSMVMKNVTSASKSIGYKLRRGDVTKQSCELNADSVSATCPVVKQGMISSGQNIELRGLAPGSYYVQVFNADWDNGNVCETISFTIDELKQFTPLKENITHPTCDNENGGEYNLPIKGGEALWQVVLTPNRGTYEGNESRIIFRNLPEGRYTLSLTDQCGNLFPKIFTLRKPKPLEVQSIAVLPGTDNLIQASVLNGTGAYSTQLTDPDGASFSKEDNQDLIFPFVKPGLYHLHITDKNKTGCPAADTSFSIKKVPGNKTMRFKVESPKDNGFIDHPYLPVLPEDRSLYFTPRRNMNKNLVC